jgi:Flp pilus assembly protein TadG
MKRAARWPWRASRPGIPQRLLSWRWQRGGIAGGEEGSSLIEFALTASALMAFCFVVMQICLAFYSAGMINECAQEATRWAITRGSTCQTPSLTSCTTTAAAIGTYAKGLKYPNLAGGTMTVDTTASHMFPDTYNSVANCMTPAVCRVKVAITYTVPITMPLVPKNSITLSTSSEMYFIQ